MTSPKWVLKTFEKLTVHELYAILRLRCEVFVVEQACALLVEPDNRDQQSHHLALWKGDELLAYSRLLPSGVAHHQDAANIEPAIGRVVVSPRHRGVGYGHQLVAKSIECCQELFKADVAKMGIRIGAQLHLKKFYEASGFVAVGEPYDEDRIMHVEMLWKQQSK